MSDERAIFEALVRRYGRPGPANKALADRLTYDGDCWTAAWREARARGGRYVEGSCRLGNHKVRAHSWVEIDGPFGPVLIECTKGYEDATHYLGIVVDCSTGGHVARASRTWGSLRQSVIESMVSLGWPAGRILDMVTP
jgi:hypothetical protein